MYENTDLAEYMAEIRQRVCSHCIERPHGGPPCLPQGKRCGVEVNLRELVDSVHQGHSQWIDPYIERFHQGVCAHCINRETPQCPCALDYLLELAVEAIEEVDARHSGNVMA
jgi:hypothetical protein